MFDVYVVGAAEPGEEGLDKLAEVMSARYGAPLEDLRGRLGRGRFRVKANVDRATAEAYVKDLTAIGGRCAVEDASTAPNQSIPPPIAVPGPARTTTPPAGSAYQSGLSAAFSGSDIAAADLGALGRADAFSLASLDGHDGHAGARMPSTESFSPPLAAAAPRSAAAAPAKPPRPRDVPVELDPFRPPDADDDDQRVEIAADEIEHRARKRMSTPPASLPIIDPPASLAAPRRPTPVPARQPVEPVAIVRAPGRLGPLGDERVRFVLGVVVAILLGFVPAHAIASMRERNAYHAIDSSVDEQQNNATTQEDYDALDAFRARQLDDKRSAHHSIFLMALVIWGGVGGGIGYVWFKRVPWDRLDAPRVS